VHFFALRPARSRARSAIPAARPMPSFEIASHLDWSLDTARGIGVYQNPPQVIVPHAEVDRDSNSGRENPATLASGVRGRGSGV
jgi:hypothetical protein